MLPSYVDSIDLDAGIYNEDGELKDDSKQVFYLYSEMGAFREHPQISPNAYEYYLFFADD